MKLRKFIGALVLGSSAVALAPSVLAQPEITILRVTIYRDGLIYQSRPFADVLKGDLLAVEGAVPPVWQVAIGDAFEHRLEEHGLNCYAVYVDRPIDQQIADAQQQYNQLQEVKKFLN